MKDNNNLIESIISNIETLLYIPEDDIVTQD
jgi:CRP-like cAMP-binding protein